MEPYSNVPKTPRTDAEAPTRRPESQLRSRFSIEPLEERIAPDKKGSGGSADPPPTYGF